MEKSKCLKWKRTEHIAKRKYNRWVKTIKVESLRYKTTSIIILGKMEKRNHKSIGYNSITVRYKETASKFGKHRRHPPVQPIVDEIHQKVFMKMNLLMKTKYKV